LKTLGRERDGCGALVWFRRDLRDFDHAALHAALAAHDAVHCVFVFDTEILDTLSSRSERRVTFIWDSVAQLRAALQARGGGLHVLHGSPRDAIPRLARQLGVVAVYANRDYESQAIERDTATAARLRDKGIEFRTCKDQVIFELDEVRTRAGTAFSVFTPYRKAWLERLEPRHLAPHAIEPLAAHLAPGNAQPMPTLADLGFERTELVLPAGMSGAASLWAAFRERLAGYAKQRDFPALDATSRLSVHLRFGTVSVRELVHHALAQRDLGAQAWL
jgi:deoxyribodipyrimidine photo-lyase